MFFKASSDFRYCNNCKLMEIKREKGKWILTMVLILDGSLEIGAYVGSNLCLRHLIRSRVVTNRIFPPTKRHIFSLCVHTMFWVTIQYKYLYPLSNAKWFLWVLTLLLLSTRRVPVLRPKEVYTGTARLRHGSLARLVQHFNHRWSWRLLKKNVNFDGQK